MFTLEEWNSIHNRIIRVYSKNEKIIDLKGERLESYRLNLIQKEFNNEQGELLKNKKKIKKKLK